MGIRAEGLAQSLLLLAPVLHSCVTWVQGSSVPLARLPRSLEDMARMVRTTTRQNALDYNDYGNYCGFGGNGNPVDGIDHCCAIHDKCYDTLIRAGCFPYLLPYRYVIQGRSITCLRLGNWCQDVTCLCDRQMAQCFTQFTYNKHHKHLPSLGYVLTKLIESNEVGRMMGL